MCGVAGYVQRSKRADEEVVQRQLAAQQHRGPDAAGVFARGRGAVGQNRLAVIDPEGGDPPITSCGGDIGAVLNGEIYNFRELRRELEGAGHRFTSGCDTEVIAHLAEDEDDVVVLAARLDGMFAFAIWDSNRQRLLLGRDRLGKKPLYYWSDGNSLAFASEIKGVLEHPDVPTRLADDAIPAYLQFGYVPSPRTFYEGVLSLPPGHVLELDGRNDSVPEPFWSPHRTPPVRSPRPGFRSATAATRRELERAVRRRLVADVPLGAFLSGGIDSSAVVAIAAREVGPALRTFTVGFEEGNGFDERPYARLVSERYRTDHTEFVVRPQVVDLVERLVWHHDQPFGDSSAIPTYLLSELTRQHVTVALAGDGGDEVFGGYQRFAGGLAIATTQRLPSALLRSGHHVSRVAQKAGLARAGMVERFVDKAERGLPAGFREWISYLPAELVGELAPGGSTWHLENYERIWDESAGMPTLDRLLWLNIRTYLLDDLLPKVDRMSMAHALEVRSSFLDHRLLDLSFSLPSRYKVGPRSLKRVLRHAVEDLLPEEILRRPKHGFGIPLDRWFREDLASYVSAYLGDPRARVRAHLRSEPLDRVLAEHGSARRNHGHALWTLLSLEVFLRSRDW